MAVAMAAGITGVAVVANITAGMVEDIMVAVANITAGMVEDIMVANIMVAYITEADIMVANIMAEGMGMGTMVVGITVIGTLAMAATGTVAGMTMA